MGDGNLLTVLFTDVEGSTELLSREGDAVAGEILRTHEEIVRRHILGCGGTEEAFLGDGFMATFEAPQEAVTCATQIQRSLQAHNEEAERPVRVRIGLHVGEVTRRGGQIYGQTVHAAARVMGEAAGAQIFVSDAVKDALADGSVPVTDRGLFWLKGFPSRWRLYEVRWTTADEEATGAGRGGGRAPFVGRDAERADIRRRVRAARGGEGGLVLIAGEPGVGKSRIIEEVASEAETLRMRVFTGHCVESGGAPYQPFVEILEEALIGAHSPASHLAALEELAPEVSRLVPGLRRHLPDLPLPLELPPEQARRYLWDSVAELVRRLSQTEPLLLVVEDLHWGDESTFQLLEYLAAVVGELPVLLLGSYRDTEVGPAHPLARTVQELTRRHLVDRIPLGRLPRDDVAALVRGLADQEPPDTLIAAIQAETEGNPFFIEEVYLHLLESGALFDADGRFRHHFDIDEVDVPETVRLVIGIRLQRLSDQTRDVLLAAAVSGRIFDAEVVRHVSGLGTADLVDAYDEAELAHLVGPTRSDPGRLAFVHELIRQTLLAETSLARRQALHAATANAIEDVHAATVSDHAADMVNHLQRAGSAGRERLVPYLVMAADRAVDTAAFEEAAGYLQQALGLVGDEEPHRRAELLERLAMALRSIGDWDSAIATMDETLTLYERLGRRDDVGRICSSMVYQLAWAARFEEAAAIARRGMEVLGDLVNPDRARLLSATGWALGLAGDHARATAMFATARQILEQLDDRLALADVLHMETAHHMSYVEFTQGADTGLRAADVFAEEGALWDLCSVSAFAAYQQSTMGLLAEATATQDRVRETVERIGHLGALFLIVADQARQEGVIPGDAERTDALGRQMIEICERAHLPWLYTGYMYRGFAAAWVGDYEASERHLRTAVELEPPGAFSGQSASLLGVLLATQGRHDEALELVERYRGSLPVSGRVNSLGAWNTLFGFVEVLYLCGRTEEAGSFLPLMGEALNLGFEWFTFDCHLVNSRAALAAAGAGEWDQAWEHWHEAMRVAEAWDLRLEQADLLYLRTCILKERGGPDDVAAALASAEEAAAAYRALGLPGREGIAAVHEVPSTP